MKRLLTFIGYLQTLLIGISLSLLVILPIVYAYIVPLVPKTLYTLLFQISFALVTVLMVLRPLADIFNTLPWLRMLVLLRKGLGTLSASIVVGLLLSKVLVHGIGYFAGYLSTSRWGLDGYTLFATLGDLSAIPLLLTSNVFSKRVLGSSWYVLQKLSYVYFYAGGLYEYLALGQKSALGAMLFVAFITATAFIKKRIQPTV